MITLLHVTIAVLSILWTTYGYIRPTNTNIRGSYIFIALTFASGFYLVWHEPAQMLHTCMSGIAYLAVVSVGVFATRRKLVTVQDENA